MDAHDEKERPLPGAGLGLRLGLMDEFDGAANAAGRDERRAQGSRARILLKTQPT